MNKAEEIKRIIDEHIASLRQNRPTSSNTASQIGDPCIRRLVLRRTRGEKEKLPDVGLQSIFEEGKTHEDAFRRMMEDAGFRLTQTQITGRWHKYNLTGHADGIFEIDGENYIVEFKSVGYWFGKIRTIEDVINHKSWIVRKWYDQIQIYLLLHNCEKGFLILKFKLTGEIKILEVELDLDRCDELIAKCLAIESHVRDNTLPGVIDDFDICSKCGFCPHECNPPIDRDPAQFIHDEGLEAELDRYHELKEIVSEYNGLDRHIKGKLRGVTGICGHWMVESREIERAGYEVKPSKYFQIKFRNLDGEGK